MLQCEVRDKIQMPTLTTVIQHCTRGPGMYKKTSKRKGAKKKNQYRESNVHPLRVQNEQKIKKGEWVDIGWWGRTQS